MIYYDIYIYDILRVRRSFAKYTYTEYNADAALTLSGVQSLQCRRDNGFKKWDSNSELTNYSP